MLTARDCEARRLRSLKRDCRRCRARASWLRKSTGMFSISPSRRDEYIQPVSTWATKRALFAAREPFPTSSLTSICLRLAAHSCIISNCMAPSMGFKPGLQSDENQVRARQAVAARKANAELLSEVDSPLIFDEELHIDWHLLEARYPSSINDHCVPTPSAPLNLEAERRNLLFSPSLSLVWAMLAPQPPQN